MRKLSILLLTLLSTVAHSAVIGYNSIGGSTLTWSAGVSENSRLPKTPGGDIVAASGDVATQFAIYVTGGSGADSTVNFGLYTGNSATDPSASPLVFSNTLVITAAMKAAPGWYTKTISYALTPGLTYRIGVGGVAAGVVDIAAGTSGVVSANIIGDPNLQNPWGGTSFGSTTLPSAYITTTAVASGGLLLRRRRN